MFFLQEPSYTDKVQAWAAIVNTALAVGSIIIAIIVAFQSKKIKELSDIVTELQKQTKTMNNRFEIEKITTMPDRMPFFKVTDYSEVGNQSVSIFLMNIGQDATDINLTMKSKESMDVNIPYGAIHKETGIRIKIEFKDQINDGYNFKFSFRSNFGFESHQTFYKNIGENYRIDPPQDFILSN